MQMKMTTMAIRPMKIPLTTRRACSASRLFRALILALCFAFMAV